MGRPPQPGGAAAEAGALPSNEPGIALEETTRQLQSALREMREASEGGQEEAVLQLEVKQSSNGTLAGSGSSLLHGEPAGAGDSGSSLLQRPVNAYTWPDDEPGFATYRATVSLYAASLPVYFSYRWLYSIAWHLPGVRAYQAFVCACEVYGACCVLLLGTIRFRRPWAPQQPLPPSTDADGDLALGADAPGAQAFQGPFDVAVLIPCCSEPDDLVFGTVRAALALRHPLATRVTVWLLDDGAKLSRSERLARLAPPANARYVARPKSKPHHGKAGNLNYTLRHVLYPQGPAPNAVLVVLDCDQEPHADFLEQTLPYLHTQPRTALVQTPQHFYNVVPSADIFNHHNGSFFYAVQPGLDAWESTVCCGTNFVARSAAVCEVGWFPVESITEDFLLSMKLCAAGHVVRYHAAAAVTGEAPEDLRQVFKQRSRWCCGCFQVFLHPQTPRLLARLRPMQALCYLNAPLGYLGTLVTLPLWAVVPVLSLAAGLHPVQALTPAFIASWCVYYALIVAVCDLLPPRLNRHLSAFTASKANASFWACYALAIGSAVVGAVLPSMQMQFHTTEKRGFSADASLRRAAPPPPACDPHAAASASYPTSSSLEMEPLTVDASSPNPRPHPRPRPRPRPRPHPHPHPTRSTRAQASATSCTPRPRTGPTVGRPRSRASPRPPRWAARPSWRRACSPTGGRQRRPPKGRRRATRRFATWPSTRRPCSRRWRCSGSTCPTRTPRAARAASTSRCSRRCGCCSTCSPWRCPSRTRCCRTRTGCTRRPCAPRGSATRPSPAWSQCCSCSTSCCANARTGHRPATTATATLARWTTASTRTGEYRTSMEQVYVCVPAFRGRISCEGPLD